MKTVLTVHADYRKAQIPADDIAYGGGTENKDYPWGRIGAQNQPEPEGRLCAAAGGDVSQYQSGDCGIKTIYQG